VKITKQARRDAKKLFHACLAEGQLDEVRVKQAVTEVAARKPRGYQPLLQHFLRLVRLETQRCTARVESAIPLPEPIKTGIQAGLARRHPAGLKFDYAEKPALIGGVRIQVGSYVYDGSVRARLAALEEKLAG
jgi:F-type H+-transporting ATPase subunit delta